MLRDDEFFRKQPERFGLRIVEDRLYCAGVALESVVAKLGTPTYVYNLDAMVARYRRVAQALRAAMPEGSATQTAGEDPLVCYALKANSNLSVLSALAKAGAGADVVSGGELSRALAAGVSADRIVYSGVGKQDFEIDAAIAAQINSINIESIEEIDLVQARARAAGRRARVSLRVNPDVDPNTHPYLATGLLGSKFGIAMNDALAACERVVAAQELELVGLACHIGSMVTTAEPYLICIRRMEGLIRTLRERGVQLSQLDIGGGLGIVYQPGEPELAVETWAAPLAVAAQQLGLRLVVEPGRYLVGNCGVLLTRVLGRKESSDGAYVIVDAAMNDIIRPALYQAYHAVIADPLPAAEAEIQAFNVVGPVCECGDFIAHERPMALPQNGQTLAVLSAGAYCFTMASNYNTRPLAAEVVVSGDRFEVARPRQKVEELLAAERRVEF